jgi:hypothetical protein
MVAGAGELVQDKQQPTLSVEVAIAGAPVEEQPVTPPVDHPPVEDPAAGASLNQEPVEPEPGDQAVEVLTAGAPIVQQPAEWYVEEQLIVQAVEDPAAGAVVEAPPVDEKALEEQRRKQRLRAWCQGIT